MGIGDDGRAAKADCKDTSALKAWLTPDGLTKGAMALSGISGLFVGDGPLQWALAAAIIVSVGIGGYLLINREREA